MKKILLFSLFIVSSCLGQTLTLNDSNILQPSPHKIGLNIGGVDFFDSGQILKNLLAVDNAGFEPLAHRETWVQNGNSASACLLTTSDQYVTYPANNLVGATYTITESTGSEKGQTGLVSANSAADGVDLPTITLGSPCNEILTDGDIITINQVVIPTIWTGNNGVSVNTDGGGVISSDITTPFDGNQSIILDTSAGGDASLNLFFDTDAENKFIVVNGTYLMSFAAKAVSGTASITYSVIRGATDGVNCSMTITPTSAWATYTSNCTATETNANLGNISATVAINGTGKIEIDDAVFQKTSNQETANTSVFRDEVYDAYKAWCGGTLTGPTCSIRNWTGQNGESLNGTGVGGDNWIVNSLAANQTFGGPASGTGGQSTPRLQDYLQFVKILNGVPYLQVPASFSTQEAANLIEFLESTNTSTGYGAKRAALGQTLPWVGPTGVFKEIYLSFCNECWNSITFPGANLPYRGGTQPNLYSDYAIRAGSIYAAMRTSPSFNATATHLGFNTQTTITFGLDVDLPGMIAKGGAPDYFEQSPYTLAAVANWQTDAALWGSALAEPWIDATFNSTQSYALAVQTIHSMNLCGQTGSSPCIATDYEQNVGTLGTCGQGSQPACGAAGSNNVAVDQTHLDFVTAGGGQGIIQPLQSLLNMQQLNIPVQNIWTITEFDNTTYAGIQAKIYGTVVDMGGACSFLNASLYGGSYCPRPSMLGMMVANKAIIGAMTNCTMSNTPTYNFPGDANNGPIVAENNVPYLNAMCFTDGGTNRAIVLINSNMTTPFTVALAGTSGLPIGTVNVTQYVPPTIDTMTESHSGTATNTFVPSAGQKIITSTLTSPTSVTVPAMSIMTLNFSTSTQPITPGMFILNGTARFSGSLIIR